MVPRVPVATEVPGLLRADRVPGDALRASLHGDATQRASEPTGKGSPEEDGMTELADPPIIESDPEDRITDSDPWLEKERLDLIGFCRSWLRDSRGGADYYRFSLAPAAAWGVVSGGGAQDRRYRVAIAEADLCGALASLPILYQRLGWLWRNRSSRGTGWGRRWDREIGLKLGSLWFNYRDFDLYNWREEVVTDKALRGVFEHARDDIAEDMADALGRGWLSM